MKKPLTFIIFFTLTLIQVSTLSPMKNKNKLIVKKKYISCPAIIKKRTIKPRIFTIDYSKNRETNLKNYLFPKFRKNQRFNFNETLCYLPHTKMEVYMKAKAQIDISMYEKNIYRKDQKKIQKAKEEYLEAAKNQKLIYINEKKFKKYIRSKCYKLKRKTTSLPVIFNRRSITIGQDFLSFK